MIPIDDYVYKKYMDVQIVRDAIRNIETQKNYLSAKCDILSDDDKVKIHNDIMYKVNTLSELIMKEELSNQLKQIKQTQTKEHKPIKRKNYMLCISVIWAIIVFVILVVINLGKRNKK